MTRLYAVSYSSGNPADIRDGDTVTADALLDLGFRVSLDAFEGLPSRLTAEHPANRFLEAIAVPDAPTLRGPEIVGGWVDEAAHFAETGRVSSADLDDEDRRRETGEQWGSTR